MVNEDILFPYTHFVTEDELKEIENDDFLEKNGWIPKFGFNLTPAEMSAAFIVPPVEVGV